MPCTSLIDGFILFQIGCGGYELGVGGVLPGQRATGGRRSYDRAVGRLYHAAIGHGGLPRSRCMVCLHFPSLQSRNQATRGLHHIHLPVSLVYSKRVTGLQQVRVTPDAEAKGGISAGIQSNTVGSIIVRRYPAALEMVPDRGEGQCPAATGPPPAGRRPAASRPGHPRQSGG